MSSGNKLSIIQTLDYVLHRTVKELLIHLKDNFTAQNAELYFARTVNYLNMKDHVTLIFNKTSRSGRDVQGATSLLREHRVVIIWFADVITNSAMFVDQIGLTNTTSAKLDLIWLHSNLEVI